MESLCLRIGLQLEGLEPRVVPAEISWTGNTDKDWSKGTNWDGNQAPRADDIAVFTGNTANAPEISALMLKPVEVLDVRMENTCAYDLTVNGTLVTKGSKLQAMGHGIVGTGSLQLYTQVAGITFHDWDQGFVRVAKVTIGRDADVHVSSTFGDLGAGGLQNLFVGLDPAPPAPPAEPDHRGTLEISGSHKFGFLGLFVSPWGRVDVVGDTTLSDSDKANGAPAWNAFPVGNTGRFTVAEDADLTLDGGYYTQVQITEERPAVTAFGRNSGLTMTAFGGDPAPPALAFDIEGGTLEAFEHAGIRAPTDMWVKNSRVDFYSPGVFSLPGGGQQTSTLQFDPGWPSPEPKEVRFENTLIQFHNYDPAGRYASATLAGGQVLSSGNMRLTGSTELWLRADGQAAQMDGLHAAIGTMTLSGDGLMLTVDVRHPPDPMQFPGMPPSWPQMYFQGFLSAMTLASPTNPFGGGVTILLPGWAPTFSKTLSNLSLSLAHNP